jgi:hypothetical protein
MSTTQHNYLNQKFYSDVSCNNGIQIGASKSLVLSSTNSSDVSIYNQSSAVNITNTLKSSNGNWTLNNNGQITVNGIINNGNYISDIGITVNGIYNNGNYVSTGPLTSTNLTIYHTSGVKKMFDLNRTINDRLVFYPNENQLQYLYFNASGSFGLQNTTQGNMWSFDCSGNANINGTLKVYDSTTIHGNPLLIKYPSSSNNMASFNPTSVDRMQIFPSSSNTSSYLYLNSSGTLGFNSSSGGTMWTLDPSGNLSGATLYGNTTVNGNLSTINGNITMGSSSYLKFPNEDKTNKIILYGSDDLTTASSFGVTNSALMYNVPSGCKHAFYDGNTQSAAISGGNIFIGYPFNAGSGDNTTFGDETSRYGLCFYTYRDSLPGGKIGSKIISVNKQTWTNETNRKAVQSADLAFFTCPDASFNYDDTVERMRITDRGDVGIGTSSPAAKLHIKNGGVRIEGRSLATGGGSAGSMTYWSGNTPTFGGSNWSGYAGIGLYCANSILTDTVYVFSDERIKTNIVDVDDVSALDTLRLIKPKRYNYIDAVKKGTEPVWGFIAQEVRSVLPYSSNLIQQFIPNIYEVATITNSDTIVLNTKSTSLLLSDPSNNGIHLKLFTITGSEVIVEVDSIIDDKTIRLKEALDMSMNSAFVYGQEIADFHTLNKDAIFTLAAAALQEVDKEQQAHAGQIQAHAGQIQAHAGQIQTLTAKNAELEASIAASEASIAASEARNAALEARMAALEARLGAQ